MADNTTQIDPRVWYGNNNPIPEPAGDMGVVPQETAFAAVPTEEAVAALPQFKLGEMQRVVQDIEAARPKASAWDSAKASASEWWAVRAYQGLKGPSNAKEDGFDSLSLLDKVSSPPDADQRKFLMQALNAENGKWRVDAVNHEIAASKIAADNPKIAAIAGMLDPSLLPLDFISGFAGRGVAAAKFGVAAQRAATFAASGSFTYAASELAKGGGVIKDNEVLAALLINPTLSSFVYKAPKTIVDDLGRSKVVMPEPEVVAPHSDAPKMADIAQEIKTPVGEWIETKYPDGKVVRERVPTVAETGTSADRAVVQSVAEDTTNGFRTHVVAEAELGDVGMARKVIDSTGKELSSIPAITALQTTMMRITDAVPKTLGESLVAQLKNLPDVPLYQVSKNELIHIRKQLGMEGYSAGFYDPVRGHIVVDSGLALEQRIQVLNHEITHALTSNKLFYGMANPESAIGKLTTQLDELRKSVIAQAPTDRSMDKYLTKNVREFAAGIMQGDRQFIDYLAKVAVPGTQSVLSKVVTAMRQILGLGPDMHNAYTKALGLTDELLNLRHTTEVVHSNGAVSKATKGMSEQWNLQSMGPIEQRKKVSERVADNISWSLYKTASSFSDTARKIMRDLIDDPVDMSATSAVSDKAAMLNDLRRTQHKLFDAMLDAMKEQGYGNVTRITKFGEATKAQRMLERDLMVELANREAGRASSASPAVKKMADIHDELMAQALREKQIAGVEGANVVKEQSGYFTRKWESSQIERIQDRMVAAGYTEKAAKASVIDLIARSMRGIPEEAMRKDVASAIYDRAIRKGYFEDSAFRGHIGNGGAAMMRDALEAAGVHPDRVQRILDSLTSVIDEAGKSSVMKHRVSMDMTTDMILPDGSKVAVMDMVNSNILNMADHYINSAAGEAALARKGMATTSDIARVRSEYLHSIENEANRATGQRMFDDIINDIMGRPSGEVVPELVRTSGLITQQVGLSGAGVWQLTDYANMAAKHGILATTGYFLKELPVFRSLMNDVNNSAQEATHVNRILSANADLDLRMKPFLQRMEDNFDIPTDNKVNVFLSNTKQYVPYLNGMKWVHGHQTKMAGNLIADVLYSAAHGNVDAIAKLETYGLKAHTMDRIKGDIVKGGMDTTKWTDGTWREIRPVLTKMMDEAVLKSRTGEVPHFAQFSKLGKFLFTFRNFSLASHNKLLAKTLGNDGFAGLSLLMLYQYPLAVLATATNNTVQGKKPMTAEEMALKAVGQVGGMGLFSEMWNTLTGSTSRASLPGTIALDRMYQVVGGLRKGTKDSIENGFSVSNYNEAGAALLNAVPLVASFGPTKAIAENLKKD